VTDAADAGNEDHSDRAKHSHRLRIMTRAARHDPRRQAE
jgi:hypothetical protein